MRKSVHLNPRPMLQQYWVVGLFWLLSFGKASAAGVPFETPEARRWADSVLATLSPAERIAQMFMVSSWSNRDSVHIREIEKLIEDWGIGGVIFFQGDPMRQALMTNDYQQRSKVPLLIGIDGEWGLSMRLDSTVRFPRQMTLSAMKNDSLIYRRSDASSTEWAFIPISLPMLTLITTRKIRSSVAALSAMIRPWFHVVRCSIKGHCNPRVSLETGSTSPGTVTWIPILIWRCRCWRRADSPLIRWNYGPFGI